MACPVLSICSVMLIVGAERSNFNWIWPWFAFTADTAEIYQTILFVVTFDTDRAVENVENEINIEINAPILAMLMAILLLVDFYEIYIVVCFMEELEQQPTKNDFT